MDKSVKGNGSSVLENQFINMQFVNAISVNISRIAKGGSELPVVFGDGLLTA